MLDNKLGTIEGIVQNQIYINSEFKKKVGIVNVENMKKSILVNC